jgi:DNA-binding MarR family transcriptional regulator
MTPLPVFDPVIHAPGRLQICALLSGADEAEFALLRERIGVSDSVLSKHLKLLEEAGYVALSKAARNGRQRTWVRLTRVGKAAFVAHVAELQRLAQG